MDYALKVKGVSKRYKEFYLDHVNLQVPKGSIMGFVGENGAGKSTTIKLILNMVHRDSGSIEIFGMDAIEQEQQVKQLIGVVFDESNFPENMVAKDVNRMMKHIYENWDEAKFQEYLHKFSLPDKTSVKEYSRGMKMKLSIAVALSHDAKLLILDEPTSGLDPFIRDEILDIFLDFIQDEEHTILVSSHIISDLEKVADYITFIHNGKIVLSDSKDEMLGKYGLLKCTHEELQAIDPKIILGIRKNRFGVEALILRKEYSGKCPVDKATIEEIMLFHTKGERV